MAQQPVELILLKQWAELMASPVWLMDGVGNLVYYNEPAEAILGLRFDEAGVVNANELSELFFTSALDGSPVATEDLPIVKALSEQLPAHGRLRIKDRSGGWHRIDVTALPLVATDGRMLGAAAIFWETAE
jgi:PAS domain-containing protein